MFPLLQDLHRTCSSWNSSSRPEPVGRQACKNERWTGVQRYAWLFIIFTTAAASPHVSCPNKRGFPTQNVASSKNGVNKGFLALRYLWTSGFSLFAFQKRGSWRAVQWKSRCPRTLEQALGKTTHNKWAETQNVTLLLRKPTQITRFKELFLRWNWLLTTGA